MWVGVGEGGGRLSDRMLTLNITIICYLVDLTLIVDVHSTVNPMDKC